MGDEQRDEQGQVEKERAEDLELEERLADDIRGGGTCSTGSHIPEGKLVIRK